MSRDGRTVSPNWAEWFSSLALWRAGRSMPRTDTKYGEGREVLVSVSTDGSVSARLARRLRPVPAAGRIETESRDSGLPAREVLEALPAAVYTIDAAGRITFFNQAAADLWGHRPELGKNKWCGSWRLYWPDGGTMRD